MPRNHVDGGLLTGKPCSVVLGIDPSLTGFAMTALSMQTDKFESWVYTSPNRGIERLVDIYVWLTQKYDLLTNAGFEVHDVAIESAFFMTQSASKMGELSATVRLWCYWNLGGYRKFPVLVPPPSAKKYATDRGNAKKAEVMLAVYKKWKVEFTDDNMADSYVLARIARGTSDSAYEAAVVAQLDDPKFRDQERV